MKTAFCALWLLIVFSACETEMKPDFRTPKWATITLDFEGPMSSEQAAENPFTDYRLDVVFSQGDLVFKVPGYFAADGNAAETGSEAGNVWRAHFRPPTEGEWSYSATLRQGRNIYGSTNPTEGEIVILEGGSGHFLVTEAAVAERGMLVRNHPRYLQWAESKDYFLKAGADSPENFLAYVGFDGTYRHSNDFREGENTTEGLHAYLPHEQDWQAGDPLWRDSLGKGLIGGLNYLASKGVNSVYMLTNNIGGDGKDVWPYTSHEEHFRFDCSKLDQWNLVFDYMDDELGMMLHLVLQETENETMLDGGDTGPERSIYFRELLARFGHHRAITWNLGEENGPNNWSEGGAQTNAQQAAGAAWFAANDPYDHYVVIHTHPNAEEMEKIYEPLLGNDDLGGLSLQIGNREETNDWVRKWTRLSAEAGAPWIMTLDELGPWWRGVDHDGREENNNQDSVRAFALWGGLMGGGAGAEWYFGAHNPQNDLGCEDWRSRDQVWTWTKHAIDFFQEYLPFQDMEPRNELVEEGQFCLAKPGEVYVVYLPFEDRVVLDLREQEGTYSIQWFNPLKGGELFSTGPASISGGDWVDLDLSPDLLAVNEDWVVVFKKI
ncbi:MAG: DUF5060 domain-containing protein [Bacteroidota bacterium]